jgi:hypothetical protein
MARASARVVCLAFLVCGCGPAPLTGKLEVVGGSAAGKVVQLSGAKPATTVTDDAGAFSFSGVDDGPWVLDATVLGTEEVRQQLAFKVKSGKADVELSLSFHQPSGRVTGHVVFADGSDAANLVVTLAGAASRAATTGAGGAFAFDGVAAGGWEVQTEVPWTREGRVAVGVGVAQGQAVDVGPLEFSPVGDLEGVVSSAGVPEAGVRVLIPGLGRETQTDAAGQFLLPQVPAGARTLVASKGAGLSALSATQAITVARGHNPALQVTLTPVPPKTGTVTGTVTFSSTQLPSIITLAVLGTSVTGAVATDGTYSLTVPVGTWSLEATAPYYPRQVLGQVTVQEGKTSTVAPAQLSWYVPVMQTQGPFAGLSPLGATNNWHAFTIDPAGQLIFVNTQTLERRHVATGVVTDFRFSARAKFAAFLLNDVLMVYEVGTTRLNMLGFGASSPVFSSDESTLFVARDGSAVAPPPLNTSLGLERITLVTATPGAFSSTGFPGAVQKQTADRFVVLAPTNEAKLVTPVSANSIFTAVDPANWSATPTPWALTACSGGNCTLKVLQPAGTTVSTVASVWGNASVIAGSTADWLGFVLNQGLPGTTYRVVRTSNGSDIQLPPTTTRLIVSPEGDFMAYLSTSGPAYQLRVEGTPPSGLATPLAVSTSAWMANWISAVRFVAYDVANHKVVELNNATPSTDPDVAAVPGAFCSRGGIAAWATATDAHWKVLLGDNASVTTPGSNGPPAVVAFCNARVAPRGQTPPWGAFNIDAVSSYVVDGTTSQVKHLPIGRVTNSLVADGNVELLSVAGNGAGLYLPASGQFIQLNEAGRSLVNGVNDPVGGFSEVASDSTNLRTIYVGRLWK